MNIRHIAKKAEVSVATVSRVLNHPETVAPGTRKRIQTIIQNEEYEPNWFARGLNFNKTGTIGLMIPHLLNPVHMDIAKGVEDVAQQKDYTTFMCNVENDIEKEKRYLDNLLKRRVDGIILISSSLKPEDLQVVKEKGIPMVLIGENDDDLVSDVVSIDYRAAANDAVNYLIDIGHREIAILYGDVPEDENEKKVLGYKDALKEHKIRIKKEYIMCTSNTIEGGYLGGKKLSELFNSPKAIFATSDLIAFGVMDAMRDAGVKVPDEVAIMGFDNVRMSNLVEPKLTTVEVPFHKMGVIGARLLFDLVEDKEEAGKKIFLQPKLQIRKSCGHKDRIGEMF